MLLICYDNESIDLSRRNPSIPIDNFKNHCVLLLELTSMQDGTEYSLFPEQVGDPLRMELISDSPLEKVTELIVMGDRRLLIAVDKFCVVGKNI